MASSRAVAAARRAGSRKRAVSRSAKAGLVFPVGRIARFLKRGRYAKFIGSSAPVYMAAVLEYLAAEVLESAGYEAEGLKKQRITPRHLTFAFKLDDELDHLLGEGTISGGGVLPHIHLALMPKKKTTGASRGGGGDQKGSS